MNMGKDIFYKPRCIFNEKLAPIETYFPMTRHMIKAGSVCICDVVMVVRN